MLKYVVLGLIMLSSAPMASAKSANEHVVTLPLDKQYVPVMRGNITTMHKTAYFGTIFVGSPVPQRFTAIFDTGSGHVFFPSTSCGSETCSKHLRYDHQLSASDVALDHDGAIVDQHSEERDKVRLKFGTGEVEGDFVYELTCIRDHTDDFSPLPDDCIMVRVITATHMTQEPFHAFAFDGVVGLGLESLALHPEFSFFGQMTRRGRLREKRFGVFVSRVDDVPSEISFGGYDATRVSEEIQWAPVFKPQHGHWQIQIRNILVGGEPLPLCTAGDCVAIVDTGTSLLGVPKTQVNDFHWRLARQVPNSEWELDCRGYRGPDVVFDLGVFNLTLGPEDYSRPKALRVNNTKTGSSQVLCRGMLLPVDMGDVLAPKVWILGEPVMRKYYTVFDWGGKQIGFSPAVQPQASAVTFLSENGAEHHKAKHMVIGSPFGETLAPTIIQV